MTSQMIALISLFALHASASEFSVRSAWKSGTLTIVEMDEHPALASGNRYFWINQRKLLQMELSWESKGEESIGYGVGGSAIEDQWIELSNGGLQLHCEGTSRELQVVGAAEREALSRSLLDGRLQMQLLPEILDPTHLFQVKGRNEFVLVKTPRYNFKGDIRVWIGRPGSWREQKVLPPQGDWKQSRPDQYRFATGGGIYLPQRIDLFVPPSKDRGGGVLVLNGLAQDLVRPRQSLSKALRDDLRPGPAGVVPTPCDLFR